MEIKNNKLFGVIDTLNSRYDASNDDGDPPVRYTEMLLLLAIREQAEMIKALNDELQDLKRKISVAVAL